MSDDKKDYYGEEAFSHLPADYGQRCTDNFRRAERVVSDRIVAELSARCAKFEAALKQVEPALADNQFFYDYEGKEYNNADIIEALDIVRKALGKGSKS